MLYRGAHEVNANDKAVKMMRCGIDNNLVHRMNDGY